eukprot:515449_1
MQDESSTMMADRDNSGTTVKLEDTSKCFSTIPHTLPFGFRCEFCNEKFQFKDRLIQHVAESHQLSIGTVKLEETSISKDTPLSYIIGNHPGGLNLAKPKCSICLKLFNSQIELNTHFRQ